MIGINRWKIDRPFYNELLSGLRGKTVSERATRFLKKFPKLTRKKDKIFLGSKQLLSTDMLDQVLNDALIAGDCPMSCEGCWYHLRDKYVGSLTRGKVTRWIQSLESWQLERTRPPNPDVTKGDYKHRREGITRFQLSRKNNGSWNALGMDLMYISKHWSKFLYFLCVVHLRSGYCWFVPLTNRKAKTLITPVEQILEDVKKRFGAPCKLVVTDPGAEFQGDFAEFLSSNKIRLDNEHKAYHCEKKIQQFGRTFSQLLGTKKVGFNKALILSVNKLNNTLSRVTGLKPIQVGHHTKVKKPRKLRKGKRERRPVQEFLVGQRVRFLKKNAEITNVFYKSYGSSSKLPKHENWSTGIHNITERKVIFGQPRYRLAGETTKWRKPWELQLVKPKILRTLSKPKKEPVLSKTDRQKLQKLKNETPTVRQDKHMKEIESDLGDYWKLPVSGRRRRKRVNYSE